MTSSNSAATTRPSTSIQSQQESILLELEMILQTVKQIDENLIKSIKLLQTSEITSSTQESYKQLVQSNVKAINDILKLVDPSYI